MNKEEFNKLDVTEQMTYLNNLLKNMSLTKACDNIGIDRATVRKRFKNNNIVFDKDSNTYVHDMTVKIQKDNTVNTGNTTLAKKPIKKVLKPKNNINNTNPLEKRVKALEDQLEALKNTINTNNTTNINEAKGFKKYTGNTVSRNYRINEKVQKEFKNMCNKFKVGTDYTVTDIISLALEDFINKHN